MSKKPKQETEIRQELAEKQQEKKKAAFLEEYNAHQKTLGEKYGLILVPILRYTEYGVLPAFAVDIYKPDDMDTKPKTNEGADSDDQAPQE